MTRPEAAMTKTDRMPGPGEARERARLRRRLAIIGTVVVAGFFSGVYVGYGEAGAIFHGGDGPWSPVVSLVLAGVYLAAIVIGGVALQADMDELDRDTSYKATAVAGAVYITLYPLWFLLWKGGFVREPIHWLVFIAFWASLAAAHLWYRFR